MLDIIHRLQKVCHFNNISSPQTVRIYLLQMIYQMRLKTTGKQLLG
jgi:hypothetical protein